MSGEQLPFLKWVWKLAEYSNSLFLSEKRRLEPLKLQIIIEELPRSGRAHTDRVENKFQRSIKMYIITTSISQYIYKG